MKKRNLIISLLLSIIMIVSMIPTSIFASAVEGSKDNPFEMFYGRNGDYGNSICDCNLTEVWFKLSPKYDDKVAVYSYFSEGEYDVKSITFYDGSTAVVCEKEVFEDNSLGYRSKEISIKEGNEYYIKVELGKAANGLYIGVGPDSYTERVGSGTKSDPYVFEYDKYSDDEYATYCWDVLSNSTVWNVLEAKDTDIYRVTAYFDSAKYKSLEILDSAGASLAKISKKVDEAYVLDELKLEQGKKYYFKTTLGSVAEGGGFYVCLERIKENGKYEKPYILDSNLGETELYYYCGSSWKNNKKVSEMWFKATIKDDGKICANISSWNEKTNKDDTKTAISSAKLYLNSTSNDAVVAKYKKDWQVFTTEYFDVKKGDTVYVQIKLTSKFIVKDNINVSLDMFGMYCAVCELDSWVNTWTGTPIEPKLVDVYFNDKTLVAGTDYDPNVTYKDSTDMGVGYVLVRGKGEYKGVGLCSYEIRPLGTELSSVKGAKKAFTAKWGKQDTLMSTDTITGYKIQYSTSSKFKSAKTVTVKGYNTVSKKISGLKKGKYYVRVRTYYDDPLDWIVYSNWSKTKTVKVK